MINVNDIDIRGMICMKRPGQLGWKLPSILIEHPLVFCIDLTVELVWLRNICTIFKKLLHVSKTKWFESKKSSYLFMILKYNIQKNI